MLNSNAADRNVLPAPIVASTPKNDLRPAPLNQRSMAGFSLSSAAAETEFENFQ
jgi:hypothetical protein